MSREQLEQTSTGITRRALVAGAIGTLALSVFPARGFAATADVQRARLDDVLDTYYAFYCPQDTSRNINLFHANYKTISYRNGYRRLYPDETIWVGNVNDPNGSGLTGILKQFKCNYEIW